MPPLALPPTSAYPSHPKALERERLDALYLELRGNYKSLMISRGIHRSRSEKQGGPAAGTGPAATDPGGARSEREGGGLRVLFHQVVHASS